MSELDGTRARVIQVLKPLNAISVENSAYPGTPDVNYVEGWIELKWLPEWPKRETTPVRIPHFTQQQRVWIMKRHIKGGNVFLLLQCRKEWLIFDGPTAFHHVGKVTRNELIDKSVKYWPNGLKDEELVKFLR